MGIPSGNCWWEIEIGALEMEPAAFRRHIIGDLLHGGRLSSCRKAGHGWAAVLAATAEPCMLSAALSVGSSRADGGQRLNVRVDVCFVALNTCCVQNPSRCSARPIQAAAAGS